MYLFLINLTGSCGGCHQVGIRLCLTPKSTGGSEFMAIYLSSSGASIIHLNCWAKIITISGEKRIIMHVKQHVELR